MPQRVLIVDDAAFMREMLRDMLTESGYEIAGEAADGEEAVSSFRELSPDLVMLDIVMPRKSGLEALDAGAKDFVVKPFKPDRALTVVAKALAKLPSGL